MCSWNMADNRYVIRSKCILDIVENSVNYIFAGIIT